VSHIAAALAKSKGKKVEAPPPGAALAPALAPPVLPMPVRSPASAAAPAPAAGKKISLTFGLGGGAALVVLAAGWFLLKPAPEPPLRPAAPAPAPVVAKPVAPAPVPAAVAPPAPAKPSVIAPALAAAAPDPALQDQVAKFSVTLRKPGTDQRAVINGKTYAPGDHVTDALTLYEVLADRVILRDDAGNLYLR